MSVDYGQQNSIENLLQRGVAAAREKRKPEARALLREVVARDPQNEQGWLWLAAVAGSPDEALLNFRRVLGINPNNQQAQAGMRWAESKRGNTGALASTPAAAPDRPLTPSPPTTPLSPPPAERQHTGMTGALFTPPAGIQPLNSGDEGSRMSLADWMAGQQVVAPAPPTRPQPQRESGSRAGFFDIDDEGGARIEARGDLPVSVVELPATAQHDYSADELDEFAGLDDLGDIPAVAAPPPDRGDRANAVVAEVAPPRPRSTSLNRARELANIGAEVDIAAGRASGSVEDLTSLDAAKANRDRRLSGESTSAVRAQRPGLLSNLPLLIGALVLAALVIAGFMLLNNNQGGAAAEQGSLISNFVRNYKATPNQPDKYNQYLTLRLQQQLAANPDLGRPILGLGDPPSGGTGGNQIQAIAEPGKVDGVEKVEYYVRGSAVPTAPVYFVLANENGWKIESFGPVGARLRGSKGQKPQA